MIRSRILTAPTQLWETTVRQAEVIGPLAAKDTVGLERNGPGVLAQTPATK